VGEGATPPLHASQGPIQGARPRCEAPQAGELRQSGAAASIPKGVRLQITLPEGSALPGVITRDWANPLLGGGKS